MCLKEFKEIKISLHLVKTHQICLCGGGGFIFLFLVLVLGGGGG